MRPSLLHPRREPRDRRRHRSRRERLAGAAPVQAEPAAQAAVLRAVRAAHAVAARPTAETVHADPDVERVRAAGGPIDQAAYSCGCGYLFSAPVSTTVSCPHCGAGQAW